jgi:integrase
VPKIVRNALNTKKIESLKTPGMHADGEGLYLFVKATGGKSWIFRYQAGGKRREMGLGSFPDVKLADARKAAGENRDAVSSGNDPVSARKAEVERLVVEQTPVPTFGAFGMEMVKLWAPTFRSAKHVGQWETSVKVYCKTIYDTPVDEVDTELVLSVLRPLWSSAPVTARRVQGRIKRILDAAKVSGHRKRGTENPAAWDGHLKLLLPRVEKLKRGHHKALPYGKCPAFIFELRSLLMTKASGGGRYGPRVAQTDSPSVSQLALEFTILTAARTSEVLLAKLSEVDFGKKIWTVPGERTKSGREHRVPLSDRAIAIIREVSRGVNDPDTYIFLTVRKKHLSNMAMAMCLRGLNDEVTVHGFRSSFRDWAGDETEHAREVAEAALGHIVGDEAEQAYRRGDALERRRKLMNEWAAYLYSDQRFQRVREAAA